MTMIPGMRAVLSLHRPVTLQHSLGFIKGQSTSVCSSRRVQSVSTRSDEPVSLENESLLQNLSHLGVDVKMVRQRQPGVLRRTVTNELSVAKFLKDKGATNKEIASIISRYPRAVTRTTELLEKRWQLWRNIFNKNSEIVAIVNRSPESFFRTSDNENCEENIAYLSTLGLCSVDLYRMLTTAPRTFSNSPELNKQMVNFLECICTELGGKNPQQFVTSVISRNLYILIRSTKRVKTNIDNLRTSLKLTDEELLSFLYGPGAAILDLSSEYLKNNFNSLQQKMSLLGCQSADVKKLICGYPAVLYTGPDKLSMKVDCLLNGGVTMKQIVGKPKILGFSAQNITGRLEELQRVGYDFRRDGVNILDTSQKRFAVKIEKLAAPLKKKTNN